MTKHDDDLANQAAKQPATPANPEPEITVDSDLPARYRALEMNYNWAKQDNLARLAEIAALRAELTMTRERLDYYRKLCQEKFGFVPTAPPGAMLSE